MKRRLILASASPRRSQLMRQIGLKPEIMPSMAEEDVEETQPDRLVLELSRKKAQEVAAR